MAHAQGRSDTAIHRLMSDGRILPDGTIRRARTRGCHLWWTARNGYVCVTAYIDGERINLMRSHIVCSIHHGNRPTPQHQVDHINRRRNDDRPENLRWVTQSENNRNMSAECIQQRNSIMRRNHGVVVNAKVTSKQAQEIRMLRANQGLSHRELGEIFGLSRRHVGDICAGKYWAA